jgi:ERO1-like protein alpha
MMGIGAALKILLLPEDMLKRNINKEEVIAFFNTLGKFSESIEASYKLEKAY